MRYRRIRIAGGTYFFTLVTASREPIFRDVDAVDLLRASFRAVQAARPFRMEAVCILPDHLHCIWKLPTDDHDYSTRWRLIKSRFSRGLANRRIRSPWQNRFWEHVIRDQEDYRRHADYIHYNPVKHGLVHRPRDWPYSSFHRWVAAGKYPEDWADTPADLPDTGNE